MNAIADRIAALRKFMVVQKVDAIYLSCTDPHMGEYITDRWQVRQFITGFTGSYGIVVVTHNHAGLWTDTRYFLQAERELQGSGISMHKLRVPDAVLPENWLVLHLEKGSRVGLDVSTVSVILFRELESKFRNAGLEMVFLPDPFETIWQDRPSLPDAAIFEHDLQYAGLSRQEKQGAIISELDNKNADYQIITMLDELAWTFNLRGNDIAYNPVFTGYGLIGKDSQVLFTGLHKIPEPLKGKLEGEGVEIVPYSHFLPYLAGLRDKRILIDPLTANLSVLRALHESCTVVEAPSIPASLKARKNSIEIEGFRNAMRKDGVALIKFLFWLKNNSGKERITEYTIGRKLAAFRSENEGFSGESFPPLVGYKDHGALVHFSVDESNGYEIEPEGMLLFDSGGHYPEGTTDVTRTMVLGTVSERQKTDFTLALKGMIALSLAKFPYGTKGCHLDILARKALWEQGLNYGHGTGHGVGHFLNVHEGPMSIRQEYNPVIIEPGMVLSNEPALYRTGQYGVRTENMMVCLEDEVTEFGRFLRFETLTLCPVDLQAIQTGLLTEQEINWLNNYHATVRRELSGLVPGELKVFLISLTEEINAFSKEL